MCFNGRVSVEIAASQSAVIGNFPTGLPFGAYATGAHTEMVVAVSLFPEAQTAFVQTIVVVAAGYTVWQTPDGFLTHIVTDFGG